jgi:hypothetical protein
MIVHAAWPSWTVIILVMVFMGPMMRMMFGSRTPFVLGGRFNRSRRLHRAEAEDLETAISERDTIIEDLQHRLTEMESRLDFAERMISERREPAPLRNGADGLDSPR